MNRIYHIFGLSIRSEIPLPAEPGPDLPGDNIPDVLVSYGETPEALPDPRAKGVRFQASPGDFLLRVDGVARYRVQDGRGITVTPEAGAATENVALFLMGSAMGALLHQRGILALHGAAIVAEGGSVVFSGPSGVGKSSLAAGLHRRGYRFLADDVCAVATAGGCPEVVPGFPRLKLWADMLRELDTDTTALTCVRWGESLEKYFLPVDGVQSTPVPLRAMFILETTNGEKAEIIPLKGVEKATAIMGNTYRFRFLEGLGGKKDHFSQCSVLAAHAAVYRTVRPRKGFSLNNLIDLVEEKLVQ